MHDVVDLFSQSSRRKLPPASQPRFAAAKRLSAQLHGCAVSAFARAGAFVATGARNLVRRPPALGRAERAPVQQSRAFQRLQVTEPQRIATGSISCRCTRPFLLLKLTAQPARSSTMGKKAPAVHTVVHKCAGCPQILPEKPKTRYCSPACEARHAVDQVPREVLRRSVLKALQDKVRGGRGRRGVGAWSRGRAWFP